MHFACDNCKASLQIADEKVRGKRLVVRCKKCGAKITISDPTLSGARAAAASVQGSAKVAAPQPAGLAPQPAGLAPQPVGLAPQPAGLAPRQPVTAALEPHASAEHERDSDTESTRAMDSDLLEKALQASKRDEAPVAVGAPPPPPPRAEPEPRPAARDRAVWFAMLGGKQTGPLSRAEIGAKSTQGAVGPRTYLWKEGMASWTRAKDVPEMEGLFAREAAPPPPPPPTGEHERPGGREFSTQDFGAIGLAGHEVRHRSEREFSTQDFVGLPLAAAPELELDRGAAAPQGAAAPAARGEPARTAAPAPSNGAHPASPPVSGDADSTQAEQLPPGVRVHQQGAGSPLFESGESKAASAVDLARWASSELGRQRPSSPELTRVPPRSDPFSQVPEAPTAQEKPQADRTGEALAFAGVQRSRQPLVVALIIGALLLALGLIWALAGDAPAPAAPAPQPPAQTGKAEAPKVPLGGTGDPAVTALAAKAEPGAPAGDRADRPAKKKPEALSADQQKDLASLDNERGVGTHGPGAAPAADAPPVEKADVGLTAEDVRKKLDQSKGALQACIDEALRVQPNLRVGKIHVATTIAPSGAVTATRIDKQTVDQSPLGACLKRATRRIVFPRFQGEAFEVDIPIVVTAGE